VSWCIGTMHIQYVCLIMHICSILYVCSAITFERRMFFKHRDANEVEIKNAGDTKLADIKTSNNADLLKEPSKLVETSVDNQNIATNETIKSTPPVAKRSRKT
jgi:hypothetical protein